MLLQKYFKVLKFLGVEKSINIELFIYWKYENRLIIGVVLIDQ